MVVTTHIRNTGMDAVFFVRKNMVAPLYTNLLEEWNQFSNEEIDTWLADESANFDEYDNENLRMAGQYLQNAVKPELWRALESTVKGRYEGPRVFVAIIRQHQIAGPAAVRELIAEIQAMSIQQEPGENVSDLAAKIYRICKRITGMVKATKIPKDLPEICAKVFIDTKTFAFNMEAVSIHKAARAGTITWDQVLTRLIDEYQALSQGKSGNWVAAHNKKEDPMIKAMQAQIKTLQDKIKSLESSLS